MAPRWNFMLALAMPVLARGGDVPADEDLSSSALRGDDECAAGGDGMGCALNALQLRARERQQASVGADAAARGRAQSLAREAVGCHTTQKGEACYDNVMWALHDGMQLHPDWYAPHGLTENSSITDMQMFVHSSNGAVCPRPCVQPAAVWCNYGPEAPRLWVPNLAGKPDSIKILSYNLFWWNLYGLRHGNGESAGNLIKAHMGEKPFDVMGFQECEDPDRVLQPVGLLDQYQVFLGEHAICMAYNKKSWELLGNGTEDVGEDMATKYYGRRGTQWMRLRSYASDTKLFFMNHHGPLSVNSGGTCGGQATAYNLLNVMAKNAQVGDTIVLVGDFNANAASLTIQTLWANLVQVFAGKSFGGVDNIFSNAPESDVVEQVIMGSGGSDHDAIYATIQVGKKEGEEPTLLKGVVAAPVEAAKELTGKAKPGYDWSKFWCGQIEDDVEYVIDEGAFHKSLSGAQIGDPERCCRECQADQACKSWVWKDFSERTHGVECVISGELPKEKKATGGFVSGLAFNTAAAQAAESAKTKALSHI